MKKKIFIIAGEKSGDLLGSKVIKQLDKSKFDITGIGGEMMENEGLKSIFSIKEISVMGVFEVLPNMFKILKRIKETAKYIIKTKQNVVLTIDSPDFCFRVIRLVKMLDKNNTIKKIHFIAPSVWMYRKNRAKKIAKIYDLLFCILPFEPSYFEKFNLKTIFVGHPIFDKESIEYEFNNNRIQYNKNSNIVAITVGSRKSEVQILLPIVLEVVEKLKEKYKNLEYYILVTDYTFNIVKAELKNKNINYINIEKDTDKKNNIIKKSLFAIAKSGTNNLEIAGYAIPMIVIYKFNFLTNIIATYILKKSNVKFVNLINIINNNMIIPEVILRNCNADNIFVNICNLINNEEMRINQIKKNIDTLKILGYKNNNSSIEVIVNNIERLSNV